MAAVGYGAYKWYTMQSSAKPDDTATSTPEDGLSTSNGESSDSARNGPDSESGQEMDPADKGGKLTKAGRAQQKHGDRTGSAFDPAKGTPEDKNAQGQRTLEDIVNSPDKTSEPNRLGGTDIRQTPDGRGARFDQNGKFTGFIEPRKP